MQLKQLANGQAISLPDDLLWTDEHAWTPSVSSTSYLVTGALLIQSALKQAGRPITLIGAPDMAWVTRATVQTLHDWAEIPITAGDGRFELHLQGRVFNVVFNQEAGAIEAEPVTGFPARSASDFYRLTLRFLQI